MPAARSAELAHRHRGVDHTVGETPLIVVPRYDADQRAVDDLGLIHVEDRGMRIVIKIAGDVRGLGVAENALELLIGRTLHRAVDFLLASRTLGDEFEVDN